MIYHADHPVFNEASLIQMIGRVGRNIEMPTGKGLFLCTRKTRDIERCIQALQRMNRGIQNEGRMVPTMYGGDNKSAKSF